MANLQNMADVINQTIAEADKRSLPEFVVYSHQELLSLDVVPMHWIVEMMIPNPGLVVISGRPGSYKTFFALWLALRVSANAPLFSEPEGEYFCDKDVGRIDGGVPTLFIEEENTVQTIKERMFSFEGLPHRCLPEMFHMIDVGFKFKDEAWRAEVLRIIEEKQIKLLILDPFSSVMGLENENDNAEVSEVMDIIRKEFVKKDLTVVLIHHPSKSDAGGVGLRGAGDILGKCDVHLSLEVENEYEKVIRVTYQKLRVADKSKVSDFRMRLVKHTLSDKLSFKYIGVAKEKWLEERENFMHVILGVMQRGHEYTRKEVAESVGTATTSKKFSHAWKSLLDSKKLGLSVTTKKFYNKSDA